MHYHCPVCNENRSQDEVEMATPENNDFFYGGTTTITTCCLMCGEQVEDVDDYEGLTNEEFRD